ncbi:unnamed protein product [Linum tenue]|uniref:Uncharacterized protein n=1 Tax=Linum tenue TaxID=586396 RepID=A0AAV0Q6M0_9ROSI|nr:unnamed protein product [Linum tenue]
MKVGKPPTRLQNKAPKALNLDQVPVAAGITSGTGSSAPIPLLSPLILSPAAAEPASVHDHFMFPAVSGATTDGGNGGEVTDDRSSAESGYTEPSSLYMSFQNQCVLINRAQ